MTPKTGSRSGSKTASKRRQRYQRFVGRSVNNQNNEQTLSSNDPKAIDFLEKKNKMGVDGANSMRRVRSSAGAESAVQEGPKRDRPRAGNEEDGNLKGVGKPRKRQANPRVL